MVITFVSNYINHHQLPFCRAMLAMGDGVEFHFVQTMPMEEKRRNMGWALDESKLSFLVHYYEDEKRAKELILDSDVVLFGWTEGLTDEIEQKRLSSGKLSFRVSERIYREGQWKFISPKGLMHKYREHYVYRDKPVYLLCTGAYVASDFDLIRCYRGKKLKWGYFPDAGSSSDEAVKKPLERAADSNENVIRLCWVGRLIDLKHPEYAVRLARHLKSDGRRFSMDIVGDGPMGAHLREMARKAGLEDVVTFWGVLQPSEVYAHMDKADVFLFTSNYLEGWGAVVNEAMARGCAVVASGEAGAVPFLLEDGVNGLVYGNGSYVEFERKADFLFDNTDKIKEYSDAAQLTIGKLWNAQNAAAEFLRFCREYLDSGTARLAAEGPMSIADNIRAPGFVRTLQEKNRLE